MIHLVCIPPALLPSSHDSVLPLVGSQSNKQHDLIVPMLPERAQDLALPECMRFRLAIKKCQPQFIIASSLVINGIIGFDFSADNARISSLT